MESHVWEFVLLCRCVHAFTSSSMTVCVSVRSSPALQDTPATVRVLHFHAWLAVFLLETRLHRHLGDLQHYDMRCDQTVNLRGDTAQNMTHLLYGYKCPLLCCRCAERKQNKSFTAHSLSSLSELCVLYELNHFQCIVQIFQNNTIQHVMQRLS